MIINFVGNFGPSGSGEISDETHIAQSFEELGHIVRRIPRDEWRECVIENFPKDKYQKIPKDLKADINIIAKWTHFFNGKFVDALRFKSTAPVFYWVWDSVDLGIEWHKLMAREADLYLSGELGRAYDFKKNSIRFYYFQFDCVDENIQTYSIKDKIYDVIYLGTCDNQSGRVDLLKEINKEISIKVWGQNYEAWRTNGFIDAQPAIFGKEANIAIAQAKVVLGTSCDPHLYGYWSNRVGRILQAGGYLLQQYTPGMENLLHDWVEYYSTPQEAIEKINKRLNEPVVWNKPQDNLFTSQQKVKDLCILIERYLKEDKGKEWLLP